MLFLTFIYSNITSNLEILVNHSKYLNNSNKNNRYTFPKNPCSLLPHFIVSLMSFHLFLAKYFLIIDVSTFVFL